MKYNSNKISFRFKNKINPNRNNGNGSGNRLILTDNPYIIGIKINNAYGYPLGINLKESIDKFNLDLKEIREIAFKFHNEKWYLYLFIRDYNNHTILTNSHYKRKTVAGIDLGEENPVVIYDGKKIKHIPKHLQYPKERIKKVEHRIKRLQACMDRKYNPEMDRFHQSKNYYKVLKKFHKAWEHLINIKKDWHFKLAHWIVTHYRNIVVDEFHNHIVSINSDYDTRKRKNCNHSMQNKSIYDFVQRLIHMCKKYGTNYFKPLTKETTNTCSLCNNINKIKLCINSKHNERIFRCERCGYTINRDENASINCYNAFYENLITL